MPVNELTSCASKVRYRTQGTEAHLDTCDSNIIAVSIKGVRVRFGLFSFFYGDTLPAQFLDGDESLVNVGVLLHEEGAEMESEAFGVKDVRRGLRQIYEQTDEAFDSTPRDSYAQYVIFLTISWSGLANSGFTLSGHKTYRNL